MISFRMSANVGLNSSNKEHDVKLIKALLNAYARKKKLKEITSQKVDDDFLTLLHHFQKNIVKMSTPDEIVSSNKGTYKQLCSFLKSCYTNTSITKPEKGKLTWDVEGREGGLFHSRVFHVPSLSSGLTIGRGYDMKIKTVTQIKNHLALANISADIANVISKAAGKSGEAAKRFVVDNDLLDFEISAQAQLKLFNIIYAELEKDVKRLCTKSDVVEAYGETDWSKLNEKIKEVLIDLRFRGDYTGSSRKFLQKSVVANDIESFKKVIGSKSNWAKVPEQRFKARVNFLK